VAAVVGVTTCGGPFPGASPSVVRRRAEKMLARLGIDHVGIGEVELSVALVDDATIQDLNRTHRKKNRPTDVLSFPMEDGPPGSVPAGPREVPRLLGDVIISVPTARRQAKVRRRPLLDELTMLLAHGLLHLCGYDHQSDREEAAMNILTRELEDAATRRAKPGAGRTKGR